MCIFKNDEKQFNSKNNKGGHYNSSDLITGIII